MTKKEAEIKDQEQKPVRFYGKTQRAADLVINNGVDEKTALMLTTGKIPDRANLGRFKEKVRKYALTAAPMQKLAHTAVKDVLQGKTAEYRAQKVTSSGKVVEYTEVIAPSHTNRLAAAAMVYDRTDPIVRQNMNLNITAEISPVDLEKYRNR